MQPDCPNCGGAIPIGKSGCPTCFAAFVEGGQNAVDARVASIERAAGRKAPPVLPLLGFLVAYPAWICWRWVVERFQRRPIAPPRFERERRAHVLRIQASALQQQAWELLAEASALIDDDDGRGAAERWAQDCADILEAERKAYTRRFPGRGYPRWLQRLAARLDLSLPVREP